VELSLRGASCPHEPFDDDFYDAAAVEYAREYVRLFLTRHHARLGQDAPALIGLFEHFLSSRIDCATVWDPAFGAVGEELRFGQRDVPHVAAGLGLRLMECGASGRFEVRLERPARLCWGSWLLPEADAMVVQSDGRTAVVRSSRQDRVSPSIVLRRRDGSWQGDGAMELPGVAIDGQRVIVPPPEALGNGEHGDLHDFLLPEIDAAALEPLEHGRQFLSQYAPIYVRWVARVLRQVLLLRPERSTIRSGSVGTMPGVIHISNVAQPAAIAEMLIHEGTHQYYHWLTRLGPVDDGTDENLYYSPIKQTGRPLRAILLAYHAFANVQLFYQLCEQQAAPDEGYCSRNAAALAPQLRQLEEPLRSTSALTDIGRALFEPLASRLS
jgi:HEXXH motif-containing protein